MKHRLFFDKVPVPRLDDLLPLYEAKEFESSFRSTVALLAYVKRGLLDGILKECGFLKEMDLHFEFTVSPPRGRGKASHTDVMARAHDQALSVEAKWTEGPSDDVRKWCGGDILSGNKRDVLSGWIQLLQSHSPRALDVDEFMDLPYQMIHRAASACAAGLRPAMCYLKFHPSHESFTATADWWHAQLVEFHARLGHPSSFPFRLATVELAYRPAFLTIAPLPKAVPDTAQAVTMALSNSELFEFAEPVMVSVEGPSRAGTN
ncbi:MAG: hypothetical protein ABIR29_11555 [Chthoniobacterales bacterium]